MKKRFGIPPRRLALTAALGLTVILACVLARFLPRSGWAQDAAAGGVVITEIMTKNTSTLSDDRNEYPDWIELTNVGNADADLRDWMLLGSDQPTEAFVFGPTSLAPGECVVVFASGLSQVRDGYALHALFRLSASGDTVTLTDRSGRVKDSVTVPPLEADTSYARAADGTFYVCSEPTPGRDNGDAPPVQADQTAAPAGSPVKISEIMASNATYAFSDGCLCDYVELYNASGAPQPLDGYCLTDDETVRDKYPLDELAIPAGGYLLIHLDGKGDLPAHAPFALSSGGETVFLYRNGSVADSVTFGEMESDTALSLYNGQWTTSRPPTPGLGNTMDGAAAIAAAFEQEKNSVLIINEVVCSNTQMVDGRNTFDWVELRNIGSSTISLEGYGLSDNPAHPRKWQFPAGAVIASGG